MDINGTLEKIEKYRLFDVSLQAVPLQYTDAKCIDDLRKGALVGGFGGYSVGEEVVGSYTIFGGGKGTPSGWEFGVGPGAKGGIPVGINTGVSTGGVLLKVPLPPANVPQYTN